MRVLIIGSGFMGSHLRSLFEIDGSYETEVVSRKSGIDLTSIESTRLCFSRFKPEIIINAAAHVGNLNYVSENAAQVCHDNSMMFINLYKAASIECRDAVIINPLANCSYPGKVDIQKEANWWDGRLHISVEPYGISKKLGFVLASSYFRSYQMRSINLLMPNAYGPMDSIDPNHTHALNGLIIRMMIAKRNGDRKFTVWGTGRPIREWIYMGDMARVIKTIVDERILFNDISPMNVSANNAISVSELAEMVRSTLDFEAEIVFDSSYQDGAPVKIMSNAIFRHYFKGFDFTGLRDGIGRTIGYYQGKI